jgi:ADP-ribosyl-[dinitrogen reductase] hydrolase
MSPGMKPPPSGSRTSVTHPIRVDWLPETFESAEGRVGLTFAPGKSGPSIHGAPWARDLRLDLDRLRGLHRVDCLVSLLESKELPMLGIRDYRTEAAARGLVLLESPIPDLHPPTMEQALKTTDLVQRLAEAGRRVVIHCRGGLGRAGTVGACLLIRRGHDADAALTAVRGVREGAVETPRQEAFLRSFASRLAEG